MISSEDAKRVFELLGSIFFYGEFKAETYNERELQSIVEKYGFFFHNESELMQYSKMDFTAR